MKNEDFVKCKDCYYRTKDWPWSKVDYCNLWHIEVKPDGYCSEGVRGRRNEKNRRR